MPSGRIGWYSTSIRPGNLDSRRREVARWLPAMLENELGLAAFVKTTGGNGLHVHVPLNRRYGFDAALG